MRTTVNLPADVYHAARLVAFLEDISLGDAIARLVRRGLQAESRIGKDKPFPCFSVPKGARPISLEQTLIAEDGA
jgi:hypothetical protein